MSFPERFRETAPEEERRAIYIVRHDPQQWLSYLARVRALDEATEKLAKEIRLPLKESTLRLIQSFSLAVKNILTSHPREIIPIADPNAYVAALLLRLSIAQNYIGAQLSAILEECKEVIVHAQSLSDIEREEKSYCLDILDYPAPIVALVFLMVLADIEGLAQFSHPLETMPNSAQAAFGILSW